MTKALYAGLLMIVFSLLSHPAMASKIDYHFLESTPVGSWQVREDTATNHKGKKTLNVVKSSLISKETRDDEAHYWIEVEISNYKIKKNSRKKKGDTVIMKSLIAESALKADLANAVNNFRAYAKEIIIQTGDKDPIKIGGAGAMADMMMKAFGVKISYDYSILGKESVSVPAGNFHAQKISGTGSAEINLIFKKIQSKSTNTSWVSKKIPFGIVKAISETESGSKIQKSESVVVKYGQSGAISKITKEVQEMPSIPNFQQDRSY